jgi:hypothetical protein
VTEKVYALKLLFDSTFSDGGTAPFPEPLTVGAVVPFQDQMWTVEELETDKTPPVATLRRYFAKPS